jgi:hypothetical protein
MSQQMASAGNNFSLSGGRLGRLSVLRYSNLGVDIEATSNDTGTDSKGNPQRGALPGKTTYKDPSFVCIANKNNVDIINKWWKKMYPPGKQAGSEKDDLLFVTRSPDNKVIETQQIRQCWPLSRNGSDGGSDSSDATTITIVLKAEEVRPEAA